MKSFIKIISAVFVITGSVIGAGFATGREIFVFFYGGNSYGVGFLCFCLFFAGFMLVSVFSNRFCISETEQLFKRLYGKASIAAEISLSLCLFFVLSTMLSAANLCLSDITGIDEKFGIYAALTAVLAAFVLQKGMNGVKVMNAIAVPLIIIFVVTVCAGGEGSYGNCKFFSSVGYVCFNIVMMSGILVNLAKNMTIKENFFASLISSILLGALVCFELMRLNDPVYSFVPMPLISIAKSCGYWFYIAACVILYLSIFTTILSTGFPLVIKLEKIYGGKKRCVWLLMCAATVFSYIGFDAIIAYAYPIMAVFGVINLIFVIIYLIKYSIQSNGLRYLSQKDANVLDKSAKKL